MILYLISHGLTGCSIVMAVRQPTKKDLGILAAGTPRQRVLASLGEPFASDSEGGLKSDLYQFRQGYKGTTKAGRALFHATADVFSFGLWEAVGTPTEKILDGRRMTIKVLYDENDLVKDVIFLEGQKIA